jgi:hypothetical protein
VGNIWESFSADAGRGCVVGFQSDNTCGQLDEDNDKFGAVDVNKVVVLWVELTALSHPIRLGDVEPKLQFF